MRYLGLRFLQSIFVLLGVSLLSFIFLELAPGNFFDEIRLNPQISGATVASLKKQYGMDQPLPVRYFRWLDSAAKGKLGFSFAYNAPVAPLLWARARNTLLLTGSATLFAWLVALPLGILSAARRHGWISHACELFTSALLATPDLLLALGFLFLAVHFRWFPFRSTRPSTPGSGRFCSPSSVHTPCPRCCRPFSSRPWRSSTRRPPRVSVT